MVSVVAAQLNDIREDVASQFQNVFTKCQAMATLADTTIAVPRTVSLQNNTTVALYSFRSWIALYNN